ncbi:FimV family protein [Ralstonia solanacearum]|uniref:Fimbriae V protein n=5 Tax=Ralstonia solanacearum TaxID=305 RepID=F6G876_RALS8|nr:Fimbriae V protein [Ralstonia solanacearum Po82]AMP72294.1 pilus assembly protein [Ralstonia solanacearum]AMP76894.1 pilus assembly protein [Ralstonia solanacearum]AYB62321.1 pilus assembly protein [Ralstonia solanacearum]MBB6589496.1 FimV family protein [Ralstonia solanacearum]
MRVSQIRQREPFLRSPRWPAVAIAVAILLLVQPAAGAAGFGSLRVRSNLGQPLQAEIDLIGITEQEGQHLAVRLASAEAYQRAGLTYNPIVSTLRASLVRSSDGGYVVRIRSAQPIGEPIVDILVDLTWGSGRLSRAYTFLLDPAGPANTIQNAAPVAVAQAAAPTAAESAPAPATASRSRAPVPVSQPTTRPARQTRQAARPQPAAPAADAAPGRTYTVRRGDSLYDIASNAVPGQDAASLHRTLLALHHDNPGAFVGGNINRLRVGSVLKLPPAVNTLIVSVREARQEGAAQTTGLAGDRSRAAADADAARQRVGSGPARMRDLAASPAGVEPAAEDPALKAMESRVAELEKNLTEMQRQLALKNEELAKLAAAAAAAQMAASTPAPSTRAPASAPAAQAPAPIAPAAPIEAETVAPAPVAKASAPATAPANAPATVRPHARQTSWFWSLLGNPMVLGLVALLGGWAVYRRSQPKPERAHGFQNSLLSREHTVIANANSLFGPAGAQNINAAQHSVFGGDFRVGGGDNNDVDPIAEADVYIAYGRDVQAEEILRETLVQQPERMAIRFKLLDIYANRQDAQGFQSVAEDLLTRVGAASPEWAEAAALGRTIDPDNPLYLTVQGDAPPPQAQAQAAPEPIAPVPQPQADTAAAEAPKPVEATETAETAETDDLPRPSTALVPQDQDTAPSAPSAKVPPSTDLELLP